MSSFFEKRGKGKGAGGKRRGLVSEIRCIQIPDAPACAGLPEWQFWAGRGIGFRFSDIGYRNLPNLLSLLPVRSTADECFCRFPCLPCFPPFSVVQIKTPTLISASSAFNQLLSALNSQWIPPFAQGHATGGGIASSSAVRRIPRNDTGGGNG